MMDAPAKIEIKLNSEGKVVLDIHVNTNRLILPMERVQTERLIAKLSAALAKSKSTDIAAKEVAEWLNKKIKE